MAWGCGLVEILPGSSGALCCTGDFQSSGPGRPDSHPRLLRIGSEPRLRGRQWGSSPPQGGLPGMAQPERSVLGRRAPWREGLPRHRHWRGLHPGACSGCCGSPSSDRCLPRGPQEEGLRNTTPVPCGTPTCRLADGGHCSLPEHLLCAKKADMIPVFVELALRWERQSF